MPLALLCPGQGAQHVGMGRDFAESFGVARRVYDDADKHLGFSISRLCFDGPAEQLNATNNAQVAIYVTSVAIYETLLELGKLPLVPQYVAGLSLGEYTALHVAGVLKFLDGLTLVKARGQLMQAAAEAAPSTMLAILGAEEVAIDEICRHASADGVIVPANFNTPGQIVVSGSVPACKKAAELAEARGFKSIPLTVAGAFHSPYMESAAEQMAGVLEKAEFSPAKIPVISNVTARPHGDSESIRKLLVQQVIAPVRWYQSIEYLRKAGVDSWLEVGPGRSLTGMMKKIDRRAAVTNISTTEGLLPQDKIS